MVKYGGLADIEGCACGVQREGAGETLRLEVEIIGAPRLPLFTLEDTCIELRRGFHLDGGASWYDHER